MKKLLIIALLLITGLVNAQDFWGVRIGSYTTTLDETIKISQTKFDIILDKSEGKIHSIFLKEIGIIEGDREVDLILNYFENTYNLRFKATPDGRNKTTYKAYGDGFDVIILDLHRRTQSGGSDHKLSIMIFNKELRINAARKGDIRIFY